MAVNKNFLAYNTQLLLLTFCLTLNRCLMARAMFDYTKAVLSKVSFDVNLFCKELQKALQRLLPYEVEELKLWVDSLIRQNPELSKCLVYLK